ncbi:GNAT family N-acetyltransferase [Roseospirillum parvum]|uniref:Putative acetyltransferase n=1 Tax=Roseospirillum parvum TaxID=83401 RepID=A0A1G7ZDI7_9PROT|nr:N-acetyltransferase [Roseospirillum parvum]SDH06758.1 putative acetyltransferase [Roseospirillum parvum]
MIIREMTDSDLGAVLEVERRAFESKTEADLTRDLLADPSAAPRLSLVALEGGRIVGHALFTQASVSGSPPRPRASVLAPLAVVPEAQRQGIGAALMHSGLRRLAEQGIELVFLVGHVAYYPRFGFRPAAPLGFVAPLAIPPEHADAWMVCPLRPGAADAASGPVAWADTFHRPEYAAG